MCLSSIILTLFTELIGKKSLKSKAFKIHDFGRKNLLVPMQNQTTKHVKIWLLNFDKGQVSYWNNLTIILIMFILAWWRLFNIIEILLFPKLSWLLMLSWAVLLIIASTSWSLYLLLRIVEINLANGRHNQFPVYPL